MFPDVLMMVSLLERALLVKLFYENNRNASATVREIRRKKCPLRAPKSSKSIRAMIKRFEGTGKLSVQAGRGNKSVTLVLVDVVTSQLLTQRDLEFGGSSARAITPKTGSASHT
ncbi:hypothetical protein TNCT_329941 [Trichonephila clavata]|uniref:DUF4817 domain-containing protein n=1 Tax=Trichonephila clavata TaxID=2740835 RepID=A0A8X6M4P8_TRICU|nr:hypothetical protein TNCT_329941 [Trichonephila clavata]